MRATSSFIMVIAVSVSTVLLLAWPRHSAAAGEADSIQQQILAKEREELGSLKTGNMKVFAILLADDAVFVDAQGPASKAQVVKNVADFRLVEYAMGDVKLMPLSGRSGLITYSITEKGISHGKEFAAHVYISALWLERGSQWVCVFSQETAAKPAKDN